MKKASKLHFFRAEFAEFLQKVGKKAEKWRFFCEKFSQNADRLAANN